MHVKGIINLEHESLGTHWGILAFHVLYNFVLIPERLFEKHLFASEPLQGVRAGKLFPQLIEELQDLQNSKFNFTRKVVHIVFAGSFLFDRCSVMHFSVKSCDQWCLFRRKGCGSCKKRQASVRRKMHQIGPTKPASFRWLLTVALENFCHGS